MPLYIVRQDITKMQVDAIVNPTNEELKATGGVDLAVHTAAGKELDEYDEEDFYTEALDFSKEHFKGKTVIVGHAPTTEFNKGAIYKTNAAINIDCGCAFDGRLGCLCLDTGREFYV